jgi:hypothetical protein
VSRSTLISSAQLLTSSHSDLQAAGAQRVRTMLWTEGTAALAVQLHVDELLLALLRPDTPQGK